MESILWNETSGLVNVSDLHVLIASISQICFGGSLVRFPVYFIPVALFDVSEGLLTTQDAPAHKNSYSSQGHFAVLFLFKISTI